MSDDLTDVLPYLESIVPPAVVEDGREAIVAYCLRTYIGGLASAGIGDTSLLPPDVRYALRLNGYPVRVGPGRPGRRIEDPTVDRHG